MSRPLNTLSVLLFPACGLCLLIGGNIFSALRPPLSPAASELTQRYPRWANRNRRAILRCEYRYYLRSRGCPANVSHAASSYNQCVECSAPDVLQGTGLPRHLPPP